MVGANQLSSLRLQDGAGDQQVEVLTRQTSPEHLQERKEEEVLAGAVEEEDEEVRGLTSHSRRMSSKGNSLLNQMSSQRKQKHREPLSWESAGNTASAAVSR